MRYHESTSIDQRDQTTRQKRRDDLARADIERTEKRTESDARIDSSADKWRYFRPDRQVK